MVVESWEKMEGRGLRDERRAELTCFVVVIFASGCGRRSVLIGKHNVLIIYNG